jgi:hypothetical protein
MSPLARCINVPRALTGVVILGCIGLLGVSFWASFASSEQSKKADQDFKQVDIRVGNKTKGMAVLSTEQDAETVTVVMRNDYSKPINGYQLYIGNTIIQTEMLNSERVREIAPGEVFRETYPKNDEIDTRGIEVLAVIFSDKTGEGEQEYVEELQEYRAGMKIQREYAVRLLQRSLNSTSEKFLPTLIRSSEQLSPFSDSELARLPMNIRFGIKDEKSRLVNALQSFFSLPEMRGGESEGHELPNPRMVKQELRKLVDKYQQTLAKL